MANNSKKKLYKSIEDRVFTGVAAGISSYLDANLTIIRLLFILFTFASGIGFVFYLTMSLILPTDEEIKEQEDLEFYYSVTKGIPVQEPVVEDVSVDIISRAYSINNVISLIIISFAAFILEFEITPWNMISGIWRVPALIIVVGLGFILKSVTTKKKTI